MQTLKLEEEKLDKLLSDLKENDPVEVIYVLYEVYYTQIISNSIIKPNTLKTIT